MYEETAKDLLDAIRDISRAIFAVREQLEETNKHLAKIVEALYDKPIGTIGHY